MTTREKSFIAQKKKNDETKNHITRRVYAQKRP